jgi:hypothetical protein
LCTIFDKNRYFGRFFHKLIWQWDLNIHMYKHAFILECMFGKFYPLCYMNTISSRDMSAIRQIKQFGNLPLIKKELWRNGDKNFYRVRCFFHGNTIKASNESF